MLAILPPTHRKLLGFGGRTSVWTLKKVPRRDSHPSEDHGWPLYTQPLARAWLLMFKPVCKLVEMKGIEPLVLRSQSGCLTARLHLIEKISLVGISFCHPTRTRFSPAPVGLWLVCFPTRAPKSSPCTMALAAQCQFTLTANS